MSNLVVVDHGAGNIPNVVRALEHIGANPVVSSSPDVVAQADRLVLPGVGAFAGTMKGLERLNLVPALSAFKKTERPLLGICVGLQILFEESDEFGPAKGLGWLRGRVTGIPGGPGFKVPHMGWSRTLGLEKHEVLKAAGVDPYFYYVHSFHAVPDSEELISGYIKPECLAGQKITAAVSKGSLLAVQFHPEKSDKAGLKLLEAFTKWKP
jgi:glutamine amidotransferase